MTYSKSGTDRLLSVKASRLHPSDCDVNVEAVSMR
jgi:hypothetical protein